MAAATSSTVWRLPWLLPWIVNQSHTGTIPYASVERCQESAGRPEMPTLSNRALQTTSVGRNASPHTLPLGFLTQRHSSLLASAAEYIAAPVTFRKVWAAKALPSSTDSPSRASSRPRSLRGSIRDTRFNSSDIFVPLSVAQQDHRDTEPISPPTASRSTVTGSTTSREAPFSLSPSTAPRSTVTGSTTSRDAPSSISSYNPTPATSLPALQTACAPGYDGLEPLVEEELDPASFDLVAPVQVSNPQFALETRSELLFSQDHLSVIFEDPLLLQRFANFLCASKPESVPLLVYYLDSLKALRAIGYANAIAESLTPVGELDFTHENPSKTVNDQLLAKSNAAFGTLAQEHLPAYITHTWIQSVSISIKRRIADTLPAHLRDLSEGLAEVLCLTDPSRPDNPIVFASEEFHRTTQYGMRYVLGRNCRFLQGPKTNPSSVRRLREKLAEGKEHCETLLNYRRDGSPFMNLLMVAPLYDSRGVVRYHIGAQVDVSGLAKECSGLDSLERLVAQTSDAEAKNDEVQSGHDQPVEAVERPGRNGKDEFRELVEMFNLQELKTVREQGGIMHRVHQSDSGGTGSVGGANWHKPRLHIKDDATLERRESDPILQEQQLFPSTPPPPPQHTGPSSPLSAAPPALATGGRLRGIYEHYLLVRPYPALRVLFASPSLRIPGMLQSSLMARIGGSRSVREAIAQALADGHGVTARVRWVAALRPAIPAPKAGKKKGAEREQRDTAGFEDAAASAAVPDNIQNASSNNSIGPASSEAGGGGISSQASSQHRRRRQRRSRDAPPVDAHIGGRRPFDGDGAYACVQEEDESEIAALDGA
ncbi:hypothetical protein GGR56DRAFT_110654 [Xylariaceae sp. FL0804]|nr:hypothetical protein GGR56DRAFT_110654 [Xylariaceae sp. FL0804]